VVQSRGSALFFKYKNMLEILKFVLSGFWIFIGFISILYIILFFIVNGIIGIVKHLRKNG